MTVVRIFLILAVLVLRAVGPMPPLVLSTAEETSTETLTLEVESDSEDETSPGDPVLAHASHADDVELAGTPTRRDADGPDEPPSALADRPPSV